MAPTTTPTPTDAEGRGASSRRPTPPAAIHAERRGAATTLVELRASPPWAPRPLAGGGPAGWARVALVQTAATLLAGDRCTLHLRLGPGARLEVVETGATVGHHVRGGPAATVTIRIELAAGARLVWLARPLVLAAGCAVARDTEIALADGAQALLRETVVLGRSGQEPGALTATTRAVHAGRPLLHERLEIDAAAPRRSPVVAGDAVTLDTVLLLGARGADLPGSTQLAGPGTLWRALHDRAADPDQAAAQVAAAWSLTAGVSSSTC